MDIATPGPARRTGVAAASLLAAGVGCAAFGLAVMVTEAMPPVKRALTLSEDVGPLAGKAVAGVLGYLVAWLVLHLALRRRDVDLARTARWTVGLTAVGFLLTFPPVYMLFAVH